MDKEFVQNLISSGAAALSSMAQAAKTTGEHLYSVLVRQQMVEGVGTIIALVIDIIIFYIIGKMYYNYCKKSWKKTYDHDITILNGMLFALLLILVLLGLSVFFTEALQKMINPEFYALKFIFESIKK